MPIPIVIPSPPPFHVKAIPDDFVQDSLVFKCGVLAKWHVNEELAETSLQPPSYTKFQEEIHVFVYVGGESTKDGHAKRMRSLYEGPSAKCFNQCCPIRRLLNEWVDEWSVHSGRFKLLG